MSDTAPLPRHLLYFADPMCSWCYGFAPVIHTLSEHFTDRLPLRLVMGGLRAGIKKIIIPEKNKKDLYEFPAELKRKIEFIPAEHMDTVIKVALPGHKTNG